MAPCASCGKKHPLSRSNQVARHFTNMPRRRIGIVPTPPPPIPESLLPPPTVVTPEEVVDSKPEDS